MSRLRQSPEEQPLAVLLNRVVDFGLGGVLFIAPLAMAGRYEPGRLLLAVIVGITGVAWFLSRLLSRRSHQNWFWTGAEWVGVFAILLVALQLVHWSPNALKMLSPEIGELLPLQALVTHAEVDPVATGPEADLASSEQPPELVFIEASDESVDSEEETTQSSTPLEENAGSESPPIAWNQVSLNPHATTGGLAMVCVFVMFFFVVLQRCRKQADIERMMKGMALSGIFMAALGIVQYFVNNGRFLWFMSHPSRDTLTSLKATFANENHFAHFLALTIGPLLWWVVKVHADKKNDSNETTKNAFGSKKNKYSVPMSQMQVLLCIGIGLVFVAGLMTYSKGGLVVLTIAAMISVGLFVLQRRVGKAAVVIVCTAAAIASLAVFLMGKDILVREMESLQTVSADSWDPDQGRRKIWTAVLRAVPDFAILGSGVGTHRYIYPTYFSAESSVQYTHAESGYLNLLLETGGPGFGLLLVGMGLTLYWLVKAITAEDEEIRFLAVPLVASLAISLLHAIFDFNWYIPANLCVTLIMVALAARLWGLAAQDGHGHRYRISKPVWGLLTIAALGIASFSIAHYAGPAKSLPSWHEFRAWSLAARGGGPGRRRELGKVDPMDPETINRMIELLDETIKHDPLHGRAHVRMASMCMRQFELLQAKSDNRMSLAQIRDAALTAGFESHDAMTEWINRVVGENRIYLDRVLKHAKEGIRLTPTEGNAYLYLAEVAFLDKSLVDSEFDLMKQAYAVRPYDAAVQFSYGRHQLMAGNQAAAEQLWKDAFQRGDSVRRRIIAAVGFQAAPQQILDLFQPGLEGLRDLFNYYRQREFKDQMLFIGPKFVVELEKQAKIMSGETAGELWYEAQFVHATLGNAEEAAVAAKNAVMVRPTEFKYHYACGLRMRDVKRFDDAVEEFRWCASRRPRDPNLPKVVSEMKREARIAKEENVHQIEGGRFQRRVATQRQPEFGR